MGLLVAGAKYRGEFEERLYVFFFKQKTAYEIGLGIPAEPLFRSFIAAVIAYYVDGMNIISNDGSNKLNRSRKARVSYKVQRSEERRVGKECRSRRSPKH